MKNFYLPLITFLSLSAAHHEFKSISGYSNSIDSIIIIHKQDGITEEWPKDKFTRDEESGINYAIDNDAQNLYLALIIKDEREQMKMMRMGMRLFTDIKGKKKESTGIEFPLKSETETSFQSGGNSGQQPRAAGGKFDLQNAKMMFAKNMFALKVFGFLPGEPVQQDLELEGNANINYTWDSTNIMQIEYLIPLKMLGEISSLNQKVISLGFLVYGVEIPSANNNGSLSSFSGGGNRGGGGGGGRGRTPGGSGGGQQTGNGNFDPAEREKLMKEQKFWTKYTITFQSTLKSF